VSSSVIVGQETALYHDGYGRIADGFGAGGAVHRTACTDGCSGSDRLEATLGMSDSSPTFRSSRSPLRSPLAHRACAGCRCARLEVRDLPPRPLPPVPLALLFLGGLEQDPQQGTCRAGRSSGGFSGNTTRMRTRRGFLRRPLTTASTLAAAGKLLIPVGPQGLIFLVIQPAGRRGGLQTVRACPLAESWRWTGRPSTTASMPSTALTPAWCRRPGS
jgi:hypothetical protein